jgi:hypothetical protein
MKTHKFVLENIYHCTVHKAGSQWIRKILTDKRIIEYTGLKSYQYQSYLPEKVDTRKIIERSFKTPFPQKTIVSPIYIDFENYKNIPKPDKYKTIFVKRDPRDLVISNYFSRRYSHPLNPRIRELRRMLEKSTNLKIGLLTMLNWLKEDGAFEALRSWEYAKRIDENVLILSYEELIGKNNQAAFERLFSHLNFDIHKRVLFNILDDYAFKKMSEGRNPGNENIYSHYRKGITGDWKNYFDYEIISEFKKATSDLLTTLKYEKTNQW